VISGRPWNRRVLTKPGTSSPKSSFFSSIDLNEGESIGVDDPELSDDDSDDRVIYSSTDSASLAAEARDCASSSVSRTHSTCAERLQDCQTEEAIQEEGENSTY